MTFSRRIDLWITCRCACPGPIRALESVVQWKRVPDPSGTELGLSVRDQLGERSVP